jgi:hypothetical protein
MTEKPRRVLISKADLLPPDAHAGAAARLGLPDALLFSAHSGDGLRTVLEALWNCIEPTAAVGGEDDDQG